MLDLTDHELGPWDVIAAEDKRYARVSVLETVIRRVEDGMRREGVEPPPEHDATDRRPVPASLRRGPS